MDRNYRTVLYLIVIFLWLWLLFLQYSTAVPAGNTYGDPNRARQESRIVWYTNIPASDAQPLANAFEKKYSIKVEIVNQTIYVGTPYINIEEVKKKDCRGTKEQSLCVGENGWDKEKRYGFL